MAPSAIETSGNQIPTPSTKKIDAEARPYIGPALYKVPEDIVVPNALQIECDERLWVPQADGVWFRPLCFSGQSHLLLLIEND